MNLKLTNISRVIVLLMALALFSICGILVPELAREEAASNPNVPPAYPYLIAVWILSIPIFVALNQVLKILKYVDENNAFSQQSVKAVKIIKICALIFGFSVATGVAITIILARMASPSEDSAGFAMLGFIIISISIVIATFTAVLQRLLQNAVDMKLENESTV